jgi:hypothetical protein
MGSRKQLALLKLRKGLTVETYPEASEAIGCKAVVTFDWKGNAPSSACLLLQEKSLFAIQNAFLNRGSRVRLRRQPLEFQSGAKVSTMVGLELIHGCH